MKVKVRYIEDIGATLFTEIQFTELPKLIEFIKASGGFLITDMYRAFNSYQLVVEEGEAYVEILVGGDD